MPATRVLNGPGVLDHSAMNGVLNISAERKLNFHTPPSIYLERELRPLLVDLIPDDVAYERAFDVFETLVAMRYIVDGGRGIPTGQYGYRGHRSMIGGGVPERIRAEQQREGGAWPPVSGGVFDNTDEADRSLTALVERLNEFHWD